MIATDTGPDTPTGAVLSDDRRYRYLLWRKWDRTKPFAVFIGLNPSTADETADDPTIRREIGFAKAWDFGGLVKLNLFGLRATDPHELLRVEDPVGPGNDAALRTFSELEDARVVAAWGVYGALTGRDRQVADMLLERGITLYALGFTNGGVPRHPLYLRRDTEPMVWVRP